MGLPPGTFDTYVAVAPGCRQGPVPAPDDWKARPYPRRNDHGVPLEGRCGTCVAWFDQWADREAFCAYRRHGFHRGRLIYARWSVRETETCPRYEDAEA